MDIFEDARINAERANNLRHQDHDDEQDDKHRQGYGPPAPGCRVSALHDHAIDLNNSLSLTKGELTRDSIIRLNYRIQLSCLQVGEPAIDRMLKPLKSGHVTWCLVKIGPRFRWQNID